MEAKTALVTGSSRGIGQAVALRLASDGWRVVVHYARDREGAGDCAASLREACAGVLQADLSEPSAASELVERAIASAGSLDALVNNAGEYVRLDFCGCTTEEGDRAFERALRVNFLSPVALVKAACSHFLACGGGVVVNVASRVGHRGEAGATPYSCAKAALINLTRALAVEHARFGIRHVAIAPGWVETAMAREGMDERLPEILREIPLGRMASPEDCAAVVAFLVRDEASYLSGVVVDVNGASYLR